MLSDYIVLILPIFIVSYCCPVVRCLKEAQAE